ncbi:MAG TPA: hypothetical protein VFT47_17530 [Vicinamibacterales bacterium]|nr:hypothetical protein [Vicinamibacterales bacterium]
MLGPEDVTTAVPAFNTLLTGVSFNPGLVRFEGLARDAGAGKSSVHA